MTVPQRRPRRRTAPPAAGALALVAGVVTVIVAVRAVEENRLEQRGTTVTVVEAGQRTESVELAEGNRVAAWVAPPFSSKGWPFVLCVASEQGEWAVHHSSDGVVRVEGTDGGRAAVQVLWTFENANADLTRWVDVHDGDRRVRRLSPWQHRQRLATFPRAKGYDEELTIVATNGLARFDSVECRAPRSSFPQPELLRG